MLKPGDIFGNYRIDQFLGEGGMGVVFKAIDSRTEQEVALKLVSEKHSGSQDYRDRLAEEAEKAATVDSPYVVGVYEHGEVDGVPFIAMEYIAGQDLSTAHGGDNLQRKIEVVCNIARGVRDAHRVGLIHRDLKPDNIKVAEGDQVKIFDFGLARTVRPDTVDAHGNIEGTLHYLSPEQVSGEPLTYVSDLFSLGTIIFEFLTGERPFEGDYAASIIYSILHEDPPAPSELNVDLPEWIDTLILKLLSKDPADRFQNVDAILDHIEGSLGGDSSRVVAEKVRQVQTVTVIDIKNLSGDESWDYFCTGFTDDVINEISRRTDLVVSAEPATAVPRNVREIFTHCRSDFVIVGSLMKWQDKIKLNLSIYGDEGGKLIFGKNYEAPAQDLFELLQDAAKDASVALAEETGFSSIDVEEYLKTDLSAYEYYLKGKTYYHTSKAEDLEFATNMFTKALEIDPDFALAHSGLADVYAFQYSAYYVRTEERIEQARAAAARACEINPKLPEAHRALGRCYMFMGDNAKAEESFLKAVEMNSKFAIGFRTLAWLKEMDGDHDGSLYWAKKSLQLSPTDLETLLLLSIINMDQRKYTLAMATLKRALELGPDYGRAYYELGSVYLKLGAPEPALENFLLAIKYGGDPNCYLEAGFIYMATGEYAEATEKFNESVKAGYMPFIAFYFLGFIEREADNSDAAAEYFNNSIEAGKKYEGIEQYNPHVMAYRAVALAGLQETERALEILVSLAEDHDTNGEVLYNVARGYAILGDEDQAMQILGKSLAEHAGPTEKEVALDPHFKHMTVPSVT